MHGRLIVSGEQVVGCIVEHEGRILLCRRGIQPCIGQWTVPAGFLELAESTAGMSLTLAWLRSQHDRAHVFL